MEESGYGRLMCEKAVPFRLYCSFISYEAAPRAVRRSLTKINWQLNGKAEAPPHIGRQSRFHDYF